MIHAETITDPRQPASGWILLKKTLERAYLPRGRSMLAVNVAVGRSRIRPEFGDPERQLQLLAESRWHPGPRSVEEAQLCRRETW